MYESLRVYHGYSISYYALRMHGFHDLIQQKKENGALGGARTHDLVLRRDALYPTELQAHKLISGAEGEI